MVSPTWFSHPPAAYFLILPLTWGLAPVLGYRPDLLEGHLPAFILSLQPLAAFFFKYVIAITHAGEAVLAFIWSKFRHGQDLGTSIKWSISTYFHGFFSLRMLLHAKADTKKNF